MKLQKIRPCLYTYYVRVHISEVNDTIILTFSSNHFIFWFYFVWSSSSVRSCIKSRNKRVAIEIYKADYDVKSSSWTTTLQKQGLYAWWNDDNNTFTILKCLSSNVQIFAVMQMLIWIKIQPILKLFFYLLRSFHNALSFFFWRKSVSIVAQQ